EQDVAAGQEPDQEPLDHGVLAHQPAADLLDHPLHRHGVGGRSDAPGGEGHGGIRPAHSSGSIPIARYTAASSRSVSGRQAPGGRSPSRTGPYESRASRSTL